MRQLLTLMAATVFVAAPCPARAEPVSIDFPVETGAPPRALDPAMTIRFRNTTFEALAACGKPAEGQMTVGCVQISGDLCVVLLPPVDMVSLEDMLHIEAHEMRHCTGQDHIDEYNMNRGVPQRQLRWLP